MDDIQHIANIQDHLFAGTVTVATLGSPNITPCDIAAGGTTNVAVKFKSLFPTASGNSGIGTRVVTTSLLSGKKTSCISGSKYVSPNKLELSNIHSYSIVCNYLLLEYLQHLV